MSAQPGPWHGSRCNESSVREFKRVGATEVGRERAPVAKGRKRHRRAVRPAGDLRMTVHSARRSNMWHIGRSFKFPTSAIRPGRLIECE